MKKTLKLALLIVAAVFAGNLSAQKVSGKPAGKNENRANDGKKVSNNVKVDDKKSVKTDESTSNTQVTNPKSKGAGTESNSTVVNAGKSDVKVSKPVNPNELKDDPKKANSTAVSGSAKLKSSGAKKNQNAGNASKAGSNGNSK